MAKRNQRRRISSTKKVTRFVTKHKEAFYYAFTPCTKAFCSSLGCDEGVDLGSITSRFHEGMGKWLGSATHLSKKQLQRALACVAVAEMMIDPRFKVGRTKIKHKMHFCRGCQALFSSQGGGENQEMHYGGCMPDFSELKELCYKREPSPSPSLSE
jgi:hypothetical protein